MMEQGQSLQFQGGVRVKDTSILNHRVFYSKIVLDSASTDILAFFLIHGRDTMIHLNMCWKIEALFKNMSKKNLKCYMEGKSIVLPTLYSSIQANYYSAVLGY